MQITIDVSEISKSIQANIVFILYALLVTVNISVQICLAFEIKKCCYFHKSAFKLKTRLCNYV